MSGTLPAGLINKHPLQEIKVEFGHVGEYPDIHSLRGCTGSTGSINIKEIILLNSIANNNSFSTNIMTNNNIEPIIRVIYTYILIL